MNAASVLGVSALFAGLLSAPLAAAAEPSVPTADDVSSSAKAFSPGRYIVTMKDAPAATYTGGISGYARTKVPADQQLDAADTAVQRYTAYLEKNQIDLAKRVGVSIDYNYTIALNGFAAELTSSEAARLAKSSSVISVEPTELLHPDAAERPIDYLDITGTGGVWDQLGGQDAAGAGVVVGVLDTGIAPENPSFAGDPLPTSNSANPFRSGRTIVFKKSDGNFFTSTQITGEEWDSSAYSTKVIGGKYFVDGFGDSFIGTSAVGEYLSPRDGDGHGSHTASTTAGVDVASAEVEGIDFGAIVGVAPEAKIAAYKVCWSGPRADLTADDGCATDDLLAGIDAAVTDGVDVINFSIGGGAATSVYTTLDAAFLNAAAAGIFVSASAGNEGPGASTSDHASPWYTTVAASTVPDYEGTVELGDGTEYLGATITVPDAGVSADLVESVAVKSSAASELEAIQCAPDSLDPAKAAGLIVVCDRGGDYARVDKSAEVLRAGGVGTVLLNVPDGSDDIVNDFHTSPTVHLHSAAHAAVHEYAATDGATATLVAENTTSTITPVPQLAGFSSHGPDIASGSDTLKPDIAAPGVSVLAAGANAEGEAGTFQFLSGTSMAAPHVAGLAALYLSQNPIASPAEIKSAIMTTAVPVLGADGLPIEDVFGEGAGNTHPLTFLEPGLVYLAGESDWKKYLVGTGEVKTGDDGFEEVTGIDPSDLNQPSIAIGDLLGSQTVSRTLTVQTAGTYTVDTEGLEGLGVIVEPTSFTAAAGDTQKFTVSFDSGSAPLDEWTTGSLTWTGGDVVARSPIAIHPSTATVPEALTAEGTDGSASVTVTGGINGNVPVTVDGFTLGDLTRNETDPTLPYTGVIKQGESFDGVHTVAEGTTSVDFDLIALGSQVGTDLDLALWYRESPSDPFEDTGIETGITGKASETIHLDNPPAGQYQTRIDGYATPADGTKFKDIMWAYNPAEYKGSPAVSPATVALTEGKESTFTVSWSGLAPFSEFRGLVRYGSTPLSTAITVTTGAKTTLTNTALPVVTGSATIGSTVAASTGTWNLASPSFTYQWTADGVAIAGATTPTFVIPPTLLGKSLAVTVTARVGTLSTAATSAASVVTGTDGGSALASLTAPKITGDETVGDTLGVTTGTWNVPNADLTFTYQWLSNGSAIAGATSSKYKLPSSSYKKKISVLVTATLASGVAFSTPSNAVTVDAKSRTTIKFVDSTITTKQKAKVKVTVSASNGASETGKVVVYYGTKSKSVTLKKSDKGKVTVTLPKLKKGTYKVYAKYVGTSSIDGDNSIKKTLKVRS